MIAGNVEPCGLSIHQKQIAFRGLVFKAHLAGPPEVGDARFGALDIAVVDVGFEKFRLQGVGLPVLAFEEGDEGVRRTGIRG